jgi:hypothetical protein
VARSAIPGFHFLAELLIVRPLVGLAHPQHFPA